MTVVLFDDTLKPPGGVSSSPSGHDLPLILVVDDTPLARTILRRTIERAGYRTMEAGSTAEAIRAYREARPDAVTMDILMDGLDGIAAIQGIRLLDPIARIVVCSATSNPVYVAAAVRFGVSAYLQKPVDPERLLASLRTALAKATV